METNRMKLSSALRDWRARYVACWEEESDITEGALWRNGLSDPRVIERWDLFGTEHRGLLA